MITVKSFIPKEFNQFSFIVFFCFSMVLLKTIFVRQHLHFSFIFFFHLFVSLTLAPTVSLTIFHLALFATTFISASALSLSFFATRFATANRRRHAFDFCVCFFFRSLSKHNKRTKRSVKYSYIFLFRFPINNNSNKYLPKKLVPLSHTLITIGIYSSPKNLFPAIANRTFRLNALTISNHCSIIPVRPSQEERIPTQCRLT